MLNQLPKPAAGTLEQLASALAWRATNERQGNKKSSQRDNNNVETYSRDLALAFQEAGLDQNACSLVVEILKYGTWKSVNTRHKVSDSARDDTQAKAAVAKLAASGAMSDALAIRIKELAECYGWHAANTSKEYFEDARKDLGNAKALMVQITAH